MSVRVLAAFDKFKDSIDAANVARTVLDTLKRLYGHRIGATRSLVLSDGGEGFLTALAKPLQLETRTKSVIGKLSCSLAIHYARTTWQTC